MNTLDKRDFPQIDSVTRNGAYTLNELAKELDMVTSARYVNTMVAAWRKLDADEQSYMAEAFIFTGRRHRLEVIFTLLKEEDQRAARKEAFRGRQDLEEKVANLTAELSKARADLAYWEAETEKEVNGLKVAVADIVLSTMNTAVADILKKRLNGALIHID